MRRESCLEHSEVQIKLRLRNQYALQAGPRKSGDLGVFLGDQKLGRELNIQKTEGRSQICSKDCRKEEQAAHTIDLAFFVLLCLFVARLSLEA